MSKAGYIYIAFNPEMPHCVKVGLTTREPQKRCAELSGTSTPLPFRLIMQWCVTDTTSAEAAAHAALAEKRVASNREFFRVEGPEAVLTVGRAINRFLVQSNETDIRNEIADACRDTANYLFTRDFRTNPPTKISPEITEALRLEITDQALWRAQWATDDGANSRTILSVIDMVAASLDGRMQMELSPMQLACNFNARLDMLMSFLSTSFYLAVDVRTYSVPVLDYSSELSRTVCRALRIDADAAQNDD